VKNVLAASVTQGPKGYLGLKKTCNALPRGVTRSVSSLVTQLERLFIEVIYTLSSSYWRMLTAGWDDAVAPSIDR